MLKRLIKIINFQSLMIDLRKIVRNRSKLSKHDSFLFLTKSKLEVQKRSVFCWGAVAGSFLFEKDGASHVNRRRRRLSSVQHGNLKLLRVNFVSLWQHSPRKIV